MVKTSITTVVLATVSLTALPIFGQNTFFTPGNIVVAVEGCPVHGGTCASTAYGTGTGGSYGDNQAAPLTLFQYSVNGVSSATYVNALVFPQLSSGANFPVSGEFGSSSEAGLQLSPGGQYLTVGGYGVNAPTFNAAYPPGYTTDVYGAGFNNGALAQSTSLTSGSYTPVPRVVALIDANGNVNSSTAVYNIFDQNNPRSVYMSPDGVHVYMSGQGNTNNTPDPDNTGGVFYAPLFGVVTSPVGITGLDTDNDSTLTAPAAQDTRIVQMPFAASGNYTLYVSVDSKEGTGNNRDFIGTLGSEPTSMYTSTNVPSGYLDGPSPLKGFGNLGGTGKVTLSSTNGWNGNNVNLAADQTLINLSPVSYFFANANTLYVADSGIPKNHSNNENNAAGTDNIGDGGLQKWVNVSGTWTLEYTLYRGLNLVDNSSAGGTCGLYGLTGSVNGNTVTLYATNYTINDLDPHYLYGITDVLSDTQASQVTGESFTVLDSAPSGTYNFKGVSFAPTIPSGSVELTTVPSGLVISTSGAGCPTATYTTPVIVAWTPGNSCTLSVNPAQTAQGVTYTFSQWQDGTTASTDIVSTPSGTSIYTATFAAGTPAITWPAPSVITYGSALSGEQLNATSSLGAGSYVYVPPVGTVLPVGVNSLTVYFTPVGTTNTISATNTITVNPAAPPPAPASLVATETLSRGATAVTAVITIANTGGTSASNVTITNVKIGADTATPLPQSIGTIAAGSSAQATVSVPTSVGASGSASSITVSGTYTGGSFSSGARIKLP